MTSIQRGWTETTLQDIAEVILGQSPPSACYNEDSVGLPFYQGKLEFGDLYPTPRKWCSAPKKIAEKGDILISVRAPVGPTNICPEKSCIGRGLAAIRPLGGIETNFLLYFLRSSENEIAGKGTGTTFNAISGSQLREFPIPLPPLPEQRRIVSKIDELFSDLVVGVTSLKKAKAELARFRQSVLAHAFFGKLTAEWRKHHRDELGSASIVVEKTTAQKKRYTGVKYKDAQALNLTDLPELPEGWVWTNWGQISDWITYGFTRPMSHVDNGIPIVTAKNVIDRKIDINSSHYTTKEECNALSEKDRPRVGDILITKDGTMGRAAIVTDKDGVFCINQSVAVIWLRSYLYSRRYLLSVIESEATQKFIRAKARGVAIQHLSITDFAKLPIPLAPPLEQEQIVNEIERYLSTADYIEKTINQSLGEASRLRQSILKRAFEGKLVPQDPSDEPASVLLETIKGEVNKS